MTRYSISQPVRQVEAPRLMKGEGRYTDDIHAYFIRSPYAHATVKKIDTKAAMKEPGVLAVLTGADAAADKVGGLICGWMIHSKDGSPMKVGPHPVLAQGKVRYVPTRRPRPPPRRWW